MSRAPQRIQRKRTKGWKMPPNTVYVGRPTLYGNPFQVGHYVKLNWRGFAYLIGYVKPKGHGFKRMNTVEDCVNTYREYMNESAPKCRDAAMLRGKDLACWCPLDQPCHADVLLEIANADVTQ